MVYTAVIIVYVILNGVDLVEIIMIVNSEKYVVMENAKLLVAMVFVHLVHLVIVMIVILVVMNIVVRVDIVV